jgi:hypothetical protein
MHACMAEARRCDTRERMCVWHARAAEFGEQAPRGGHVQGAAVVAEEGAELGGLRAQTPTNRGSTKVQNQRMDGMRHARKQHA